MSIEARREYLSAIRVRYQNTFKREKTRILDEFCAVCGYSRKYAIRILQGKVDPKRLNRPGPKPTYGPEVVRHLQRLWEAMNRICSKNLRAALALWLPLDRSPGLSEEIRQKLLQLSPSTIDRLLGPYRQNSVRGISTTKGSWIKSKIPIELLHEKVQEPGFIEADTVAHCGNSTHGQYVNSLTMTDLYSAWTENRACFTKDALAVLGEIRSIERSLPFAMKGFACDNGSEFLNESLYRHFQEKRQKPIHFVRRRPYKKNDAAHVEQKNYTHVRQIFGYERLEDPELAKLMNEIYREYWNPLLNFFTPTMKLKEKKREGARVKKKYELPQTPCQRLLDADSVPLGIKQRLIEYRNLLNPFKLKEQLDKKLKIFFQLVELNKRRMAG